MKRNPKVSSYQQKAVIDKYLIFIIEMMIFDFYLQQKQRLYINLNLGGLQNVCEIPLWGYNK